MPGDTPFQSPAPGGRAASAQPGGEMAKPASSAPWYSSLWHTIADAPHLPPAEPGQPVPALPDSSKPTTPGCYRADLDRGGTASLGRERAVVLAIAYRCPNGEPGVAEDRAETY